jgi:hypothetical protein
MIINQYSAASLKKSRGSVTVVFFVSDLNFEELIARELPELENVRIESKEVFKEGEFTLWNCIMIRNTARGKVEGSFLALQTGYFVFVITDSRPSFMRECVMYLSRELYPSLMISYITAEEIFEILQHFSKARKTELLYSKYVAKKMFGRPFTALGYAAKKKKNFPFTEAFSKARNLGLWIDSIRVFSEDDLRIDFRLSRGGFLTYYRGTFEGYYNDVLVPIQDYSIKRLKVFEKKGRRENPDREPQLLLINFDSNVFEDTFIRKELVNVIASYDFCNYSVIHDGNPHVYINIVDRVDNSAFSLRTYGSNSLVIVPEVKATKASLMRFSKHIMDKFREGKISTYTT